MIWWTVKCLVAIFFGFIGQRLGIHLKCCSALIDGMAACGGMIGWVSVCIIGLESKLRKMKIDKNP